MLKIIFLLVVVVAVAVLVTTGLRSQARLTFDSYDKLPEYYWAGDFDAAAECEDTLRYLNVHAPASFGMGARCAYAPRFRVWWLMAKNIALVQAPNILSVFR